MMTQRLTVEQSIEVCASAIEDVALRCLDTQLWTSCKAALQVSDSNTFVTVLRQRIKKIAQECHNLEVDSAATEGCSTDFDCLLDAPELFMAGSQDSGIGSSSSQSSDSSESPPSSQPSESSGFSDSAPLSQSSASNDPHSSQDSQESETSLSQSSQESAGSDFDDLLEFL